MPDIIGKGLWADGPVDLDTLPISAELKARILAWSEWNDELDGDAWARSDETEMHWERMPGAPVEAFNAEAKAIGEKLRAELPDWEIVVVEVDSWLR